MTYEEDEESKRPLNKDLFKYILWLDVQIKDLEDSMKIIIEDIKILKENQKNYLKGRNGNSPSEYKHITKVTAPKSLDS